MHKEEGMNLRNENRRYTAERVVGRLKWRNLEAIAANSNEEN